MNKHALTQVLKTLVLALALNGIAANTVVASEVDEATYPQLLGSKANLSIAIAETGTKSAQPFKQQTSTLQASIKQIEQLNGHVDDINEKISAKLERLISRKLERGLGR